MTPSPFNCATHVQFAGTVNQAAYSPSTFAPPSSLSHLEDMCHTPTAFPNDQYYVMSDANGTGSAFMKRYLKTEERRVLCDIGYTVNTTYGNTANLNFFNYGGSACPGLQVAGINDGINSSGFFQYTVTVGGTIPVNGVLSNDFNAVSFECLQDIYGNGTVNTTSGTFFNYTATAPGLALLRYIPVSSSGNRGNITYIYVLVQPVGGNCNYTSCNLIPNGDFESTTSNCGSTGLTNSRLNCWSVYVNTPDLYGRNCTPFPLYNIPGGYNSPPSDTWNNGANSNNHYLGLFENTPGPWGEASQVTLSTGLVNGNAYQLRFWARVPNNYQPTTAPFVISIVATAAPIQIAGSNFNSLAPGLTPVVPSIVIPNNNQWNYIVQNFTYTGPSGLTNFIIGADPMVAPTATVGRYLLMDDIELLPFNNAAIFNPPTVICINQTINDLSLFASPAGGVFTGNGVTLNAGIYSFNPTIAGVGTHLITYTYTTNTGCQLNTFTNITVVNSNINIAATANPTIICPGAFSTLTATGANTYVWNPGSFTGNPYVVSPTSTTTYTVTGTNAAGCTATAQVTVNVDNTAPLCCAASTLTIPNGTTSSSLGAIPNGSVIDVLGLFTINSNLTLTSCTLRMAPNAKIDVLTGNTFALTGCVVFSCTDMWDGIYSNPGANVNITLSRIEDATNAVYSVNGGNYNLFFSTFNKNNISLYVDNFNATHPGIVRRCIFECVATSSPTPGATLKAPMAGQISHFGIYCRNNVDITFGQVAAQPNIFRFIEIGIYAQNTQLKVYRNNFTNITEPYCITTFPPTTPCPTLGWPIWVQSSRLTVGDPAGTSHQNNFTNCSNGIFIDGKSSFDIQKNNFTNIVSTGFLGSLIYSKCIYARFNAGDFPGIIHDNVFTNFEAGIYYQANKLSSFTLLRNKMSNFNTSNGTAIYLLQNQAHPIQIKNNLINELPNQIGWYGIRVQNAVQPSNNVLIAENTIKNVRHGVWTTNYDNIIIRDQTTAFTSIGTNQAGIYYPNTVPAITSVGIKVENCPKTNVYNNLIQKAMPNPTTSFTNMLFGISVETNSVGTNVQENEVRRLGKGLNFYGTPNGPLTVTCNKIYQNRTGVSLNNTFIGDQGMPNPSGIAQDNQWSIPGNFSTNWLGAERSGTSPTTTWYARSTALPFFPNQTNQMVPGLPTPAITFGNASGAPYNCTFGCANPPCFHLIVKKMITKQAPFDGLDSDAEQMIDMKAYQMIKQDSTYITTGTSDDALFIAYRDSLANTNIGRLYEFTEKLAAGDTLGAYASLMAVAPTRCPETSQKIVYGIYWKTWARNVFEFEPNDSLLLYQIAEQKPHICGTAVYDARVMLGLDFNDFEDAGQRVAHEEENEISINDEDGNYKGVLYPNPASDYVIYKTWLNEGETLTIVFYDVMGKPIISKQIIGTTEEQFDLSEISSGIYFYKITLNQKQVQAGKLIISK